MTVTTAIDYAESALIVSAAALAASEKDWQGLQAILENTDPGILVPVAFGLGVLSGQAIIPGSDMSSPLNVISRLLGSRYPVR